jgi:hypothetical protein
MITHAAVMTVQSYQHGSLSARTVELSTVWGIGIALLVLAPRAAGPAGTPVVASSHAA